METPTESTACKKEDLGRDTMPKTPAGGQINCDWEQLKPALQGLSCFLSSLVVPESPDAVPEWHVVFRCGTVVRVTDADPEFQGYQGSSWRFPEAPNSDTETIKAITMDNEKVWIAQARLGHAAIRRAYQKLVSRGYPYPGEPTSARTGFTTGITHDEADELFLVSWPRLEKDSKVLNLSFSQKGLAEAVSLAGDRRRQDYMFPEVAAMYSPKLVVWTYGLAGSFSSEHPLY